MVKLTVTDSSDRTLNLNGKMTLLFKKCFHICNTLKTNLAHKYFPPRSTFTVVWSYLSSCQTRVSHNPLDL